MVGNNIDINVKLGKEALDREDYDEAYRLLLPSAKNGNAEAQANIGFLYYVGEGVKRNLNEAIKWLTSAAKAGRGEAAHNLGTLYLTCEPDLPKNLEESKKWYRKAQELGFIVADTEFLDDS